MLSRTCFVQTILFAFHNQLPDTFPLRQQAYLVVTFYVILIVCEAVSVVGGQQIAGMMATEDKVKLEKAIDETIAWLDANQLAEVRPVDVFFDPFYRIFKAN